MHLLNMYICVCIYVHMKTIFHFRTPAQQGNARNAALGGAKLFTALDDLDEPNTFFHLVLFSEEIQLRFDSGKV